MTFGRRLFLERPDFAADAVHDHDARPIVAHQQAVVGFLDARLTDDVTALEVVRAGDLRIADLADVSEKVRRGDVVIWDGDPLELSSAPEAVWIDGVRQPLDNHQTKLRDRYRSLERQALPEAYRK